MRRSVLVTGLLLLHALLFLTGTICTAQTATITGVVYEKDQIQTTFTTPQGKIKVSLPDDVRAGDVISGTVIAQPSGSNEKEQKKNLSELLNYQVVLPGGKPVNIALPTGTSEVGSTPITFTVPPGKPIALTLQTPGNKAISTIQIPILPALPSNTGSTEPIYTLAKKVISNDEPLVLLTTGTKGSPGIILHSYYNSSANAPVYSLTAGASSPNKSVYTLPEGLSGLYTVCVETADGKSKKTDLVNVVDINASIGKGNLMKGENTELYVEITGLEGCPYRPVQLEISNKTPTVIQLAQGNEQIFPVDQQDVPQASVTHQPYQTIQNVTGQMTGNFEIKTTLHIPPSAYANGVLPYFTGNNNTMDYNSSIKALKNDITHYIASPNSDKNLASYLQQIKEKFPLYVSATDLERSKAIVANLLNPVSNMPGHNIFYRQLLELGNQNPEVAEQLNVPQLIHPLHDLAGEFNSATKQLQVNAADKESLLKYLGATKMDNGNYSFSLSDGTKPVVYADVPVITNEPHGGCDGYDASPPTAPVKEEPKKDEQAGNTPKDTTKKTEESIWPKKEKEWTDSTTGRRYRFYKDAECKLLQAAQKIDCSPQKDYVPVNDKGNTEWKETGKYSKWEFQDTKRCVKGSGFCVEMYMIVAIQTVFEDKDCKRMIEVKKYDGFSCQ